MYLESQAKRWEMKAMLADSGLCLQKLADLCSVLNGWGEAF